MANLFHMLGSPTLPNWLKIFICTQLFLGSMAQPGCIRCEDFNRIQPPGCAQDYTQCGSCLPNFIEDTDDLRICYAVEILTDAEDEITQEVDNEVYLICKFNALVNCKWNKDGKEVKDIGPKSNRQWAVGKGTNTDDCSLVISHLSDEDVGSWVCSSRANGHMNEISSKPTQLNIKPTLINSPAAYYEVVEGNSVTLACVFDPKVTCSWLRNGKLMSSNENYHFTKNAANCSLTIGRATAVDSGQWKCTAPGTSNRDPVSSQQTTLKVTKAIIQESPLIYYGGEVVNGATLMFHGVMASLHCQMPSADRLWWVLDNDSVYQEQSNRILNMGPELSIAMAKQLQQHNKNELVCVAEDELKQMTTANVFFIADVVHKPEVTATASSFNTIFIMLLVFTTMVAFAIAANGALIFTLMRRKSNLKRNRDIPLRNINVESQLEIETHLLQHMDSNEASHTSKA